MDQGPQLLAGNLGQDPCEFTLKILTCLVFALQLQLREPQGCFDTGSVGLALIYIYLENLTSRHVVSSWKKHWDSNVSKPKDGVLRRQQTGSFVFSVQVERKVTCFISSH